jgi:hypothetical protein
MKPRAFRWEIILLLVVAVALTVGIIGFSRKGEEPSLADPQQTNAPLQIIGAKAFPEGDHARIELLIRYDNKSATPLVCESPAVRLLTGKEREIPPYFEALALPPEIPAKSVTEITLSWWALREDLASPLRLVFPDTEIPVQPAPSLSSKPSALTNP